MLRELMLGIIVVGLVVGLVLGRNTERARRAFKDWGAAKSAVPKAKTIMISEVRRALVTGLIIAIVFVAVVTFVLGGGTES